MPRIFGEAERRKVDRAWRERRETQRSHDLAARNAFRLFTGGDVQGPLSVHPMRHLGIWPNGMSDGPVDFTWDPVDLFGGQKR
jgi:hypothetical protein